MGDSNIKNGNIYPTKRFGNVEVIEYLDKYNITIMFLNTSSVINVTAASLRGGECVDNNVPTLLGIGYLGYGKYSSRDVFGKKKSRAYQYWSRMLRRCYSENSKDYPDYGEKGVIVCEEWHNFQNFAEWFYNEPFNDRIGYHLDKDILIVNNKVYCPEACNILPPCINTMGIFTKSEKFGVTSSGKWRYHLHGKGNSTSFDTKEECEKNYLSAKKESLLLTIDEQFSMGNITVKIYKHLLNLVEVYYPLNNKHQFKRPV